MPDRMTAADRPLPIGAMLDGSDDIMPRPGRYACRGDCGGIVERPGVCGPCGVKRDQRAQDAALAPALASIPPEFRWARADAPEMPARVRRLRNASPASVAERVKALALEPMVLIVGASGEGKTSLACAVIHEIIAAGRYPAPAAVHEVARRARFYAARSLTPRDHREATDPDAPTEGSPRGAAARASVLLLDDVGQEAGDGYKANDRSKVLADVLSDRHDAGARTIITTFASEARWREMYGDGVARRYWDAARVKVVRLDAAVLRAV